MHIYIYRERNGITSTCFFVLLNDWIVSEFTNVEFVGLIITNNAGWTTL